MAIVYKRRVRNPNARGVALGLMLAFVWLQAPHVGEAQTPARRAAVIESLRAHPGFYHGQAVALVGTVTRDGERMSLTTPTGSIGLASREPLSEGPAEVRGVLLDVGRLTQDDPRLVQLNLREAMQERYREGWPRPGEELLLAVASTAPSPATSSVSTPSLRALALTPDRFEGERVTVTGQFRGRNLYGDTPEAPTGARESFVLRAGDGAVWVTDLEPRGQGFSLDPNRRVDTGRWLRVSGLVRQVRGIVYIEGTTVALATPPAEAVADVSVPAPPPPRLEVLFSAPTSGETEVPLDERVRIQFSRDVDPASLKERVRVSYAKGPAVPVTVDYSPANRALEIRFAQPLERFRQVTVELLEGITGTDGSVLQPWSLTFTTGG